jgi:hypothetical protein
MESNGKKYWFPAKKYGWGWGPPCCWQGWAVFVGWLLLEVSGTFLVVHNPLWFVIYSLILAIGLIIICFLKGEKPDWRWGGK